MAKGNKFGGKFSQEASGKESEVHCLFEINTRYIIDLQRPSAADAERTHVSFDVYEQVVHLRQSKLYKAKQTRA